MIPEEDIDISAIRRGDETAFNVFYKKYSKKLYVHIFSLTRDDHLSKEIFQIVIMKILKNAKPDFTEAQLWSWIKIVAKSSLIDFYRKNKTHENIKKLAIEESGDEENKIIDNLNHGIDQLSEMERSIINLKYFESYSLKEISQQLGITIKAVERRLSKTRIKLKNFLRMRRDYNE